MDVYFKLTNESLDVEGESTILPDGLTEWRNKEVFDFTNPFVDIKTLRINTKYFLVQPAVDNTYGTETTYISTPLDSRSMYYMGTARELEDNILFAQDKERYFTLSTNTEVRIEVDPLLEKLHLNVYVNDELLNTIAFKQINRTEVKRISFGFSRKYNIDVFISLFIDNDYRVAEFTILYFNFNEYSLRRKITWSESPINVNTKFFELNEKSISQFGNFDSLKSYLKGVPFRASSLYYDRNSNLQHAYSRNIPFEVVVVQADTDVSQIYERTIENNYTTTENRSILESQPYIVFGFHENYRWFLQFSVIWEYGKPRLLQDMYFDFMYPFDFEPKDPNDYEQIPRVTRAIYYHDTRTFHLELKAKVLPIIYKQLQTVEGEPILSFNGQPIWVHRTD